MDKNLEKTQMQKILNNTINQLYLIDIYLMVLSISTIHLLFNDIENTKTTCWAIK